MDFQTLLAGAALLNVWVNTALVAAAAEIDVTRLRKRRRAIGAVRPVRVLRGAGPEGAFATFRVTQVGHRKPEGPVLFHDRSFESTVYGGEVAPLDGTPAVAIIPRPPCPSLQAEANPVTRVWVTEPDLRTAAAQWATSADAGEGLKEAQKARGLERELVVTLGVGSVVWINDTVLANDPHGLAFVGVDDPDRWAAPKIRLVRATQFGLLATLSGLTWLALSRPWFGGLSTVGGVLLLAFFLLIQPLGTAVRDRLRPPHRAYLRGTWQPATPQPRAEIGPVSA